MKRKDAPVAAAGLHAGVALHSRPCAAVPTVDATCCVPAVRMVRRGRKRQFGPVQNQPAGNPR